MEPLQFCYWLQGFAEINDAPPTEKQWKAIQDYLQTVFNKKTPVYRSPEDYYSTTTTTAIC